MDFASFIIIGLFFFVLFMVFGGARAMLMFERGVNFFLGVENSIRRVYSSFVEKSMDHSRHWFLRLLLGLFVHFSHIIWLALALIFVVLAYYGKAMRAVIRGFIS